MIAKTNKRVIASLIVATGVAPFPAPSGGDVALAQAMNHAQAYAAARVDTVFDMVATMPVRPNVILPMAMKGDFPVPLGCFGISVAAQAECMDVAYELPAVPSIVIESHEGTTTTLMRMDAVTIAGVSVGQQLQSE